MGGGGLKEECGGACDVRGGHGGAGFVDEACGGFDIGAFDGGARGEEVDARAEVGEGRARVGVCRGGDGEGFRGGGWGLFASVDVVVACGGGDDEAFFSEVGDGGVDGGRDFGAEGEVDDAWEFSVGVDPFEGFKDGGGGSCAGAVEDAKWVDGGGWSDACGGACDGGGDVGAVACAVGCSGEGGEVSASGDFADEFGVCGHDAGVDDVDVGAFTVHGGEECSGEWKGCLVDAVEAPEVGDCPSGGLSGGGLRGEFRSASEADGFDIEDIGVFLEFCEGLRGHVGGDGDLEGVDWAGEGMLHGDDVRAH